MTRLYCTPAHRLAARRLRRAAHEEKTKAKTAAPSRSRGRGQAPGPSRHRRRLTAGLTLITGATLLTGTAVGLTQAVYSTPGQPAKHARVAPGPARHQLSGTEGIAGPKAPTPGLLPNASLSPLATTMEQLSSVQTALKALLAHSRKAQTPSVLALIHSEASLLQRARSLEDGDAVEQARRELAGRLAATGKELNATDTAGHVLRQATSDGPSPDLAATEHDLETHKSALTGKVGILHGAIGLLSTPLHSVVPALTGTTEPAQPKPGQGPAKHAPHPDDPPAVLAPSGTKRNDPPVKTARTERPPVLGHPPNRTAPHSPSHTTTPATPQPNNADSRHPATGTPATDLRTNILNHAHTTIQQASHATTAAAWHSSSTNPTTDLGTQISNYTRTMIQQQMHSMLNSMQ